jgi:hypothetical protein
MLIVMMVVMLVMMLVRRRGLLQGRRGAAGKALRLFVDQNHSPAAFRADERGVFSTTTFQTHNGLRFQKMSNVT